MYVMAPDYFFPQLAEASCLQGTDHLRVNETKKWLMCALFSSVVDSSLFDLQRAYKQLSD